MSKKNLSYIEMNTTDDFECFNFREKLKKAKKPYNYFKEIKDLLIKRYHPISNMRPDAYGNQPYFDLETKSVVYLKKENYGN